jgi:hypothetical protein
MTSHDKQSAACWQSEQRRTTMDTGPEIHVAWVDDTGLRQCVASTVGRNVTVSEIRVSDKGITRQSLGGWRARELPVREDEVLSKLSEWGVTG